MDIQKAGEGSTQIQAQNITIIQGIDEKRAREIYDEKYGIAKRDLTEEAIKLANERVKILEESLIPKIEAIDNGLKAFADPGFQLLLIQAQKTAAATERPEDYDLLAELLVHRIKKGQDRKIRTGIHRAIEIIEDIPDDALLGLTVLHAYNSFLPIANNCSEALDILDNLFQKVIYNELPEGEEWIDNLDILDAIRVNPIGQFIKVEERYIKALENLLVIGIRKNSEEYNKAIQLLTSVGLPNNLLKDNQLCPGYVKLNLPINTNLDEISLKMNLGSKIIPVPLNNSQKGILAQIIDLYNKEPQLKKQVEDNFKIEFQKRSNLMKLDGWISKFKSSFNITAVGKVLAHANAQRCDKTLPPLN